MAIAFSYVLIDLSGTLHIGDKAIAGAVAGYEFLLKPYSFCEYYNVEFTVNALRLLDDANIPFKFVTNTTKESIKSLAVRLTHAGFDERFCKPDLIHSSLRAASTLITRFNLHRPFCLVEDDSLNDLGLAAVSGEGNRGYDSVIVGLAPTKFSHIMMSRAMQVLLEHSEIQNFPKRTLIALHKGRYYRSSDGTLKLGPGPFVSALEYATDTTAVVVGKPAKSFFLSALPEQYSVPGTNLAKVVMIGDDVRDDVVGALQHGFLAVLVKTGKYKSGDEEMVTTSGFENTNKRFFLANDFAHAVEMLIEEVLCKTQ